MTVHSAFIEPMLRNFDEPPGADAAAFFADLEDDLCTYDDDRLLAAARHIRQTRKYRKFPTIAECVDACRDMTAVGGLQRPTVRDKQLQEIKDKERKHYRACYKIREAPLGREALEAGWLNGLLDFVTDNERLPDDQEVRDLQWRRDEIERNLEAMRNAPFDPLKGESFYAPLRRLRNVMVARAAKDVFGDQAKLRSRHEA